MLASTRIGPLNTSRTARSVARSSGPPHLILSAGKPAARRARSATTAGSSMPIVKSVGGMVAGSRMILWTGMPIALPTRSCSAISTAHFAAPFHRIARSNISEMSASPSPAQSASKSMSSGSIRDTNIGITAAIVSGVSP